MFPLNSTRSQLKLKSGAIAQTRFSKKFGFLDVALMARLASATAANSTCN
jgi:hypothetical protein